MEEEEEGEEWAQHVGLAVSCRSTSTFNEHQNNHILFPTLPRYVTASIVPRHLQGTDVIRSLLGPKQNKGRECMVWFSASSPEYTSILHPYLILLLSASPRALRPTALPGLLPDFGPNKDPNSFESSRTVTLHLKDNNTFYRISFHQHYISHHHNIMTQLKVSHNGHNPC